MSDQLFVPGIPINTGLPLVVNVFHDEWMRHYPEIAQIAVTQPAWEGKTFLVWPIQRAVGKGTLVTLAGLTDDRATGVKNYPHPIRDAKRNIIAVVIHQAGGYEAYDSLYTYRGRQK